MAAKHTRKQSQPPAEPAQPAELAVRWADPEEPVDISTVQLRPDLPREERIRNYIRQVKNPYCYLSHGVVVKVSFTGACSLEACLGRAMQLED